MYDWQKTPEWQAYSRLDNVPKSEYPRIWSELRDGHWSEDLGEIPEGVVIERGKSSDAIHGMLDRIELTVGKKACLRYCHKLEGSTDQMFDDWWDSESSRKEKIKCLTKSWDESTDNSGNESSHNGRNSVRTALGLVLSFLLGCGFALFFFC